MKCPHCGGPINPKKNMKYQATCDGEEIEFTARSYIAALEKAEKWILGGDYAPREHTYWVEYGIRESGESVWEWSEIAIDPPEPKCTKKRHKWLAPVSVVGGLKENPGVYGHGGGVNITTCCKFCGMFRIVDTWAQNPVTGKQGLDSTSYRDATDRSLDWISKGGKEDL